METKQQEKDAGEDGRKGEAEWKTDTGRMMSDKGKEKKRSGRKMEEKIRNNR